MSTKADRATNKSDHLNDDEQEATELQAYTNRHAIRNAPAVTTAADDGSRSVPTNRPERQGPGSIPGSIRAFWARHVVVTVSQEACRDHFGEVDLLLGTHWAFGSITYGFFLAFSRFGLLTAVSFGGCLASSWLLLFCTMGVGGGAQGAPTSLKRSKRNVKLVRSVLISYPPCRTLLSPLPSRITLTEMPYPDSSGKDVPGVPTNILGLFHARRSRRSAVPSPAHPESGSRAWLLRSRGAARDGVQWSGHGGRLARGLSVLAATERAG